MVPEFCQVYCNQPLASCHFPSHFFAPCKLKYSRAYIPWTSILWSSKTMHWINNPNMHRIRLPPHLPWVWQWRGWFVVTCQGKSFPCTNQAFLVSHMPAKQTRIFWRPIETTEVSLVKTLPLYYSLSVAAQTVLVVHCEATPPPAMYLASIFPPWIHQSSSPLADF